MQTLFLELPLKKFLEKKTLNAKVNNWAVEISPYKIKFLPEPEGYEFGYYAFEELDPIRTEKDTYIVCNNNWGMTK